MRERVAFAFILFLSGVGVLGVKRASAQPGCSYTIMPPQQSVPSTGGTGRITIATATGCTWTAASSDTSWLTIASGAGGTGSGVVVYQATANTGARRTAAITIVNTAFDITQPGDPAPESGLSLLMADLPGNRLMHMSDLNGTNWESGPLPQSGTLSAPWHVTQDSLGRIYVADRDNNRIVRMNDITGSGWTTFDGVAIGKPIIAPHSVTIGPDGKIYIADSSPNGLIRIDDMTGANYINFTGTAPGDATSLCGIKTVTFDQFGRIYMTDTDHYRIVRITDIHNGAGFTAFGANPVPCGPAQTLTGRDNVNEFNRPEAIVHDGQSPGHLYITDNDNHRIVRIDDTMDGAGWTTFGSLGSGVNQVNEPHDVRVTAGRIYILDTGNGRVVRINDMTGAGWTTFGAQTRQFGAGSNVPPGFHESIAPKGLWIGPPLSSSCAFAISPGHSVLAGAGGSGNLTVTTTPLCGWAAVSNQTWLTVSGATGTGGGTVTYTAAANPTGTPRVAIVTLAGSTIYITQEGLTAATMSLDKTSLTFAAVTTAGGNFTAQTQSQAVRMLQAGPGTVSWQTSTSPANSWLMVTPPTGTGSGTLTVGIRTAGGLPPSGNLSGTVTVSLVGSTNATLTINVSFHVIPSGAAVVPQGSFDTPTDGLNGVSGSIAVTGWAVDDVDVTRVRILRDPVAGEPAGSLVFIGNAVTVDGARPDVQSLFPSFPRSYSAGWGYLMLTNFLPSQGNGTFKLYAIADDADGHSTMLGSKTITCTNASAITPFGAIDTPAQGETVSGIVTNFGWTLIKGTAHADTPGGGTVTVVVDGVPIGSPGGWTSRADLTQLFGTGGFNDLTSTLAVLQFDTTAMSNGLHSIAWVVTATNGQAAGMGSRYFTVSNGAGLAAGAASGNTRAPDVMRADEPGTFARTDAIMGRQGFDFDTPYRTYGPRADGVIVIDSHELDRIELEIEPGAAGYLRAGRTTRPLPAGSRLDPETGVFTWQPGVGFVGAYDFVFVTAAGQREIRIVLNPRQ